MVPEAGGTGGADRRGYPRSPIIVREARCLAGMEVFFGYATNISREGLFIGTPVPQKRSPGEVFEIRFSLPGTQRAFSCRVSVVWSRPYRQDNPGQSPGFGLKFLDLPEEDAETIDSWVRSAASEVQ